jgi:hypothetical protein
MPTGTSNRLVTTHELVRGIMMGRNGAPRTVRSVAAWTGRPAAEVRAEIEAMERGGLIELLHRPSGERFWIPTPAARDLDDEAREAL